MTREKRENVVRFCIGLVVTLLYLIPLYWMSQLQSAGGPDISETAMLFHHPSRLTV
jgi:ABC-type glycerol-3-phosphate transport system permease component